jgi:hypothetical protein
MKKTLLALPILIALTWSCKKEDPTPAPSTPASSTPVTTAMVAGLPSGGNSVDAYLYAGYSRDVSYQSDFNLSTFSAFADASRNLFANYDHLRDRPSIPAGAENCAETAMLAR